LYITVHKFKVKLSSSLAFPSSLELAMHTCIYSVPRSAFCIGIYCAKALLAFGAFMPFVLQQYIVAYYEMAACMSSRDGELALTPDKQ